MSNLRSAEIITKSLLARRTRFGPNKVLTGVSCFFSVPTSCITVCRLQQGFLVSRVQGLHLPEKVTLGVAEERLGKRSKGRCTKFWSNLSSTFSSLPLPRDGLLLIPIPHFSGQPGTHPASRGGRSSQELSQLRSSPKRLPSRPIRGTRGAGPASPGHAAPLLTRRRRNRSHAGSRSQVLRARRGRAARSASCVRGFPQCPAPAAAATAAAL